MAIQPAKRGTLRDARIELIEDAVLDLSRKADFAREIGKLWGDAQQKFVLIGRHLNRAKTILPHGEYQGMIERELPFGRAVAHQLRAVAEAIDAGALPAERLPTSYSVVYQITTLSTDERHQALQAGVIRPDMTRADLIGFKRALRTAAADRRAGLERERARLHAEQRRIQERLRAIARELGEESLG